MKRHGLAVLALAAVMTFGAAGISAMAAEGWAQEGSNWVPVKDEVDSFIKCSVHLRNICSPCLDRAFFLFPIGHKFLYT